MRLDTIVGETKTTTTSSADSADAVIATILDLCTGSATTVGALRTIRANQHTHERAWFDARGLICARYQKKRDLNALLTGIGGSLGLDPASIDREEAAELVAFDKKVRIAMTHMYQGQRAELASLGITTLRDEDEMRKVYKILNELVESTLH